MMTTATVGGRTVAEWRAMYARVRGIACRELGWTVAEFNDRAANLAHELADGEEKTPADWYQAATEIAWLEMGAAKYERLIGR